MSKKREKELKCICNRIGLNPVKYTNLDEVIAKNLQIGRLVDDRYSTEKERDTLRVKTLIR